MSAPATPRRTSAPAPASSAPSVSCAPPRGSARTGGLDWRVRFAFLSVVWGFSFLFIKVGTGAFAPFQVALGRVFFGALALLAVLLVRREPLPRGRRTWGHLTVAALLLNTAPFALFAYAEQTITSTLAGSATRPPRCGVWRSPWSRSPRTAPRAAGSRDWASASSGC